MSDSLWAGLVASDVGGVCNINEELEENHSLAKLGSHDQEVAGLKTCIAYCSLYLLHKIDITFIISHDLSDTNPKRV